MGGADPYRAPTEPARDASSATLVLRARSAETQGQSTKTMLGLVVLTAAWSVAFHFLSMVFELPTLVTVTLVLVSAAVATVIHRFARPRKVKLSARGPYVTLRIGAEPPRVVMASDITEITLDHTPEPGFAVVGHGVRSAAIASATGRARILIKLADDSEVRVPTMALSHTEIVEWLGDVRRFMRAAGFARVEDLSPDSESPIAHLDQAEP